MSEQSIETDRHTAGNHAARSSRGRRCPDLLNDLGHVVVVDVVALEATYFREKPYAREVRAWIDAGKPPGRNRPVEVASTEFGRL